MNAIIISSYHVSNLTQGTTSTVYNNTSNIYALSELLFHWDNTEKWSDALQHSDHISDRLGKVRGTLRAQMKTIETRMNN